MPNIESVFLTTTFPCHRDKVGKHTSDVCLHLGAETARDKEKLKIALEKGPVKVKHGLVSFFDQ